MTFKKLSFLYLVFILFLFFSSPGNYVVHYDQMQVTQEELNGRLNAKLISFDAKNEDDKLLKETTLQCLQELDELNLKYKKYANDFSIYGDKLKENQFAEKQIRNGSLAASFNSTNEKMEAVYSKTSGKSLKSQIIEIRSFTGESFKSLEFFFKETPNAVVGSVLEHLKTVYLYSSITQLFKQQIILPQYKQVMLEEANFIQRFKRLLVLGNSFDLSIKPSNNEEIPQVKINGNPALAVESNSGTYEVNYIPTKPGKYTVEVNVGEQRLFTGFEVLKPAFRFVMEKSNFNAIVGEKMLVSLDTQYLPSRGIAFISDKAQIVREGDRLTITPNEAGMFRVKMMNGKEQVDDFVLYAKEAEAIEVGLLDIAGDPSSLNNASRLESLNTYWQVVSFRMTIIDASGNKKSLRSATRYLRNDLREAEQLAETGSVLVFDDIKLISKNRGITKIGRPIILKK
jgi:hypothetical protein